MYSYSCTCVSKKVKTTYQSQCTWSKIISRVILENIFLILILKKLKKDQKQFLKILIHLFKNTWKFYFDNLSTSLCISASEKVNGL